MSGTIGNLRPDTRLDSEDRAPLQHRVLAALSTWVTPDGIVVEPTTGDIAARLGIRAESYERDELNHVLTSLRTRWLTRYEHDPITNELRWRLTRNGWIMARTIRTGVTGFDRSAAGDRERDRFAQVRDGTVRERRDGRP